MQTENVRVSEIRPTSNVEVFNLVLRQEITKPMDANGLAFFLPKVIGAQIEKRVAFRTVDQEFMDEYNIFESEEDNVCDFAKAIGMPCKIVVDETFEQRSWESSDGTIGEQEPKINPQTGEVLTSGGQAIYRNSRLTLDMDELDEFIAHDKVSAQATTTASAAVRALTS